MTEKTCACGMRFGAEDDDPRCWRCRPLEETTGPDWLPESYTLKLTALDVGYLTASVVSLLSSPKEAVAPAGILRLLRKLETIVQKMYEERTP